MRHLLFRLYGPLASWGDVAPGRHRPTVTMPTRSAVLGLLAAALGTRRDDEPAHERLSKAIGIAARQESSPSLFSDYHTAQTPTRERNAEWATRTDELTRAAKVNTILTEREYLQDAAFTIATWERAGATVSLDRLESALRTPRYPPFLGRRSCPTALPFGPHVVDAPTLREAFAMSQFPDADVIRRLATDGRTPGIVELDADHPAAGYDRADHVRRRDQPVARDRRTFAERVLLQTRSDPGVR